MRNEGYGLSAIKRQWVPEWLWAAFAKFNLPLYQPFRFALTRPLTRAELYPPLQPTYFVQHPDGTYSVADPQPQAQHPKG